MVRPAELVEGEQQRQNLMFQRLASMSGQHLSSTGSQIVALDCCYCSSQWAVVVAIRVPQTVNPHGLDSGQDAVAVGRDLQ